jgi:putative polyhydroxyalkanoate system protein
MADVLVRESHTLGTQGAIKRLAEFESMLSKYGIKPAWKGNRADINGTGVKGSITATDTEVVVELSLGMVARMAGIKADKLTESIRKRLRAAFDA